MDFASQTVSVIIQIMKLVILNAKNRYRPEDLKRLRKYRPVFYEAQGNKLENVKELWSDEGVILAVQPTWVKGIWQGLPWDKIKKIKNLKGLVLSTTAYGWAPFRQLGQKGIPVTNVPGKSTDAVSEYYLFMMIGLLRKFPHLIKKKWKYEYGPNVLGTDAKNLVAGIVGLGKIGQKIADLCHGYGMKVVYWSRNQKKTVYQSLPLDNLCRQADVIFVTTVADDSTRGLIDKRRIDLMKKTALFLSPVDETVYDRKYLLEKVARNKFGGLGFESSEKTPLTYEGNVLALPEIGYYTQQTLANESRIMTDSIVSLLKGKPRNVVNL